MTPEHKHIADRDWPEDFDLENGNYLCQCCLCKETFAGHKRRVVCKLCDQPNAKAAPEPVQGEAMRARFDEIEREIMEGKHTAASVFTQMRTAAVYMAAAKPDAELVELLGSIATHMRHAIFAPFGVPATPFDRDSVALCARIDAKLAELRHD